MSASLKRRLDSLATTIKPLSLFGWLSPDERAALLIAELKYMYIPEWTEQAARDEMEQAARGELAPRIESPEAVERQKRLIPLILAANDRVRELEAEGQLQGIVDSLKAKGVWHDEWSDQAAAGEA